MTPMRRVGIIGGHGWLGRSIDHAMLEAGLIEASSLTLSCRAGASDSFADWPEIFWTADNQELVRRSDVVIVSVRPGQFPAVEVDAGDRLVISLMAGVSMQELHAKTGSERIVRAMPNAAAEIRRSYTAWFCSDAVSDEDRAFVQALFESCGKADEVATEADIEYLTALSGSGPAFPALLADALLSHALSHGLSETVARRAVEGVVCDAAQLIAAPDASPSEIVRTFMNYRSTTDAGLQAMMGAGFTEAVHAGLSAATAKAASMGGPKKSSGRGSDLANSHRRRGASGGWVGEKHRKNKGNNNEEASSIDMPDIGNADDGLGRFGSGMRQRHHRQHELAERRSHVQCGQDHS